ncbi:MAG: hypothetical protein JKX85_09875, partial [Phycisphaeraceae bacterium]|nr:hypothetical protein [Phycisphaeraceae bacterium]
MKKTIHLVCNAHLDPAWQWTWEDGLAQTMSTFRIAADFCDAHPEFVFNHNESLLYGWIKEHEPTLFARIQKLVKKKQWHISGGAFLQPDVNTPTGESHIRQFLYGLNFFKDNFDQRPTTAYNFDPFGHPEGFAQVLAGCGMDAYIFCRPDFGTYDLPVGCFNWTDRSRTTVTARRSDDFYLTRPHSNSAMNTKLPKFLEHYQDEPTTMLLWGIGNHGGGVSREEYKQLQQITAQFKQYDFVQSTPEAFIAQARKLNSEFPTVQGEMERSFTGCYTSMGRVKQAFRATEHLMQQTETLAALAWWTQGVDYPRQALDKAWRDILFNTFHDILPGSGIPQVEQDALMQLGHANTVLRETRFSTLIQLVGGGAKAKEGHVPIFITNPHAFAINRTVEFEYVVASHHGACPQTIQLKQGRKIVAYQRISSESNLNEQSTVRLAVNLRLKPLQVIRLDASLFDGKPKLPRQPKVSQKSLQFKTPQGTVQINPRTGLIDSIIPKGSRQSLVKKNAMQPILFEDLDHSWTCGDPAQTHDPNIVSQAPTWKKPTAPFKLATAKQAAELSPIASDKWGTSTKTQAKPIRIIENGEQYTLVEALFICGPSVINRHYVISHLDGRIEVRDRIFFNHKDHMLKLNIPLNFKPIQGRSEACYSVTTRKPTKDYAEHPNQRWVAAEADNGNFLGVINDASNAHNLTHKVLAINVLRSPAYTSFILAKDDPYNDHRFAPRQDQGEHQRRYELVWGN